MKRYFSFQWHITDTCDQRCKHCYIYSSDFEIPKPLCLDQLLKILDNCLEFCEYFSRTPYFFITGGDPLLHPDFFSLLEVFKEKGIAFSILGNPFHLNEEITRRLAELGCEMYQLSLDGLEKTHDWFRKPGSFRENLRVIPLLKNAGIQATFMSTVSNINKDELLDMMDEAVQAGVDLFSFGRYCPTSSEKESDLMSPAEYRKLLEAYDNKARKLRAQGCKTSFGRKDHLFTLLDYEKGYFQIPKNIDPDLIYDGCNCGNAHLTIDVNGNLLACRRVANSEVGNALKDRIVNVWLEPMEKYRDFEAFEKCRNCILKSWCRGCPAVAAGVTRDFYSTDPQCWMDLESKN